MNTAVERRVKQVPPLVRSGPQDSWARLCATAGAVVWAGMAVLARMGVARIGAIELLFLFAPLVIVPLGMELGRGMCGGGRLEELARRMQPVGAVAAVVAMWMPPGERAGIVALGWFLICVVMGGAGVVELIAAWRDAGGGPFGSRSGQVRGTLVRVTLAVARIDLVVGGAWLVASRWGMRPMGIQEPIGLLTAVHFHFAGFATATIAAATLGFAERRGEARPWLRAVVGVVAGMPFVVAAGFVVSPVVKMWAAILFSASVAWLAIAVRACGSRAEDGTARMLLQVAAGAIFAGMVLSASYAVADYAGSEVLTIPQMARTHGVLNAVGFCLPGLLGWILERGRWESSRQ
jgi:hypothetical protein